MKEQLKKLEEEALKEIESAGSGKDLIEAIRVKYVGRKGLITEIFKKINAVPPDERPEIGKIINIVKENVTARLNNALSSGTIKEDDKDSIDISLPGVSRSTGTIHPITRTIEEISQIFISLGFRVIEGPEIETEKYNFEALNIPLEHPSRDAFDTFYLKTKKDKYLLRSHTSPVQARFMEKHKPPFLVIAPGRVYRPDATDARHSFMFHQVEGLVVSESITFADLKGVLLLFARQMFGEKTNIRFRPSFFPFTEPSAEVDVSCILCSGTGTLKDGKRCSLCGGEGWLEILGAGMVNPKVFKAVGYDTEKYTGFAFGMGVERVAILKYGINDIRLLFENDLRFLKQF